MASKAAAEVRAFVAEADALALLTKKAAANHEARRAALRLVLDTELRLGALAAAASQADGPAVAPSALRW